MTQNGKIYARVKDIAGDIKTEGGYAEGEVTIIDRNAPTPGSISVKMASLGTPYVEETEVYQNVAIELIDGQDEEGGSGIKSTTYNVTGIPDITELKERTILKARDENYEVEIKITTEDNAGNISTAQNSYIVRTIYAKETKNLQAEDRTYYLPEGFKLAEDSATAVSDGIAIEDRNGNQWVWIPCYLEGGVNEEEGKANKVDKYNRYILFNGDNITTQCGQSLPTDEEKSIKTYGGFFIGRYEAGDGIVTNASTPRLRVSGDSTSNTVTLKKGQAPYEYVSYQQSVTLSQNIKQKEGYKVGTTKLTSGYAWDTTIKFIERKVPNYGSEPIQSNMANFTGFKYIDITKKEQTKNEATVIPTGQTPPACNIYDLCGNIAEFSSERYLLNNYDSNVIIRGTRASSSSGGAGTRVGYWGAGDAYRERGFRPAYFL